MLVRILFAAILLAAPTFADDGPPPVVQKGTASIYADRLQGKPTASGEPHDKNDLTAASRILPLGATARVTNLETGQSVEVEINDRGPYTPGRVIDLSKRAAEYIGLDSQKGIVRVIVEAYAADQPTLELEQEVARLGAARAVAAKAQPPKKRP